METHVQNLHELHPDEVLSLPTRDGNCGAEGRRGSSGLVLSLPTRDGNELRPAPATRPVEF